MTKPRTPEEIAYDVWVAVHTPGNLSREVIFAALREAADARDAEWKDAANVVADTSLLGPKPIIEHVEKRAAGAAEQKAEARIASLDEQLEMAARAIVREKARADAARREERDALNELLRTEAASWPELGAALLFKVQGLLDARSRAEEPKKP